MAHRNIVGVLLCFALAVTTGCARGRRVESASLVRWSGMGVSIVLPAGSWEVEDIVPGSVVEFRQMNSPAHVVLMRVEARTGDADGLAVLRLFSEFREKRMLRRWARVLPNGCEARCAECLVSEEGREILVRAYVMARGTHLYELVAWGLASGAADGVADGVVFAEADF